MNPIWLDTLFTNKLFRIPDYQRWYAWQNHQLQDFWDDLINLNNGRSHYTWVLSLKEVPVGTINEEDNEYWLIEDHSYKMYDIVDWQQRLTTCIIFIQSLVEVLRNLEGNIGKTDNDIYLTDYLSIKEIKEKFLYKQRLNWWNYRTYKFWYHNDNPSYMYLRHSILWESNPWDIEETFYTLNLKNAKDYFILQIQKLYSLEWVKWLVEIYKKISQRFLFNEYIIEEEFDVFVAFETMNNRWKNLSKLELLKNRLIYLTTLFSDEELDTAWRRELRNNINNAWKEVYHQLGRNQNNPLNDDEFLKAHWIMSFPYTRTNGDDYVNFLLNRHFSPKRIFNNDWLTPRLTPTLIADYVSSLQSSVVHWYNSFYPFLSSLNQLDDDTKKFIDKLNRIGMLYFRPLLMSVLKNENSPERRCEIFKNIERFIFIIIRLKWAVSNYWDSVMYNISREFDRQEITYELIIEELNKKSKFSFDENWEFISKFFENYMFRQFNSGEKKWYYKWNWLQYFLYEYELYKMEKSWQPKVTWDLFIRNERDRVSIEHIFPQTPTEEWKTVFNNVLESNYSFYNWSLGNLLLLSQSINSSLQNVSFADKKNPNWTRRMWYSNGSHSEIEVAIYDNWTSNEIKERGLKLLDFMENRWDINLWSEENKLRLLFLP